MEISERAQSPRALRRMRQLRQAPRDLSISRSVVARPSRATSSGRSIRNVVRRKLKHHRLPEGRAVAIREIGRFASDGRQCGACDERIGPNQKAVMVMVSLQWMSVFFHDDCYKAWDAERLALFERDGEGTRPSPWTSVGDPPSA